ncbi:iron dicitrate transport regulator FecR [Bordetella genomosp. 5]|uniref:FecR domain-containing protein n=1 Tax=Bordetella genomosp. 5 TaxID=1395608 RepID=UPI000B9EA512|nr:FecR domain-containing protein [Bordetella genomosp. 5]OZI41310.1 iron dicitrate transport regulator FecR [Bordetella genomosp. 5]
MTVGPDDPLFEEAADWVIRLRYEPADVITHRAFERWLAQGEAHARAWARAEQVLGAFEGVPARIGHDVLRATRKRQGRRAVLRATLGLGVAVPVGWMVWREAPAWRADLRTAAGEPLSRTLEDGTRLVLNSGSAVDLRYGAAERRLVLLAGEVLVTTGQKPQGAYRPFVVQTPQGEVQALGTRFSVRLLEDRTQVMVFEHAVMARPVHAPPLRIDAGQRASFTVAGTSALAPVDDSAALWERGMLVVRDQRLADVVAELARHRPGVLRCAPAVAELRVSGALSLRDTDAALAALAERLPIAVRRVTRYWVSVGPADA